MARFFRRGVSKVYFLPAVAGASPTRAEITAGDEISEWIAEVSGFQLTNSPIAVPDLATAFTKQIGGEDTVADSAFTVYDDKDVDDLRDLMPKGTEGFLFLAPYGNVAAKRGEVWPVTVVGYNDEWSVGNDPARAMVGFACTDEPNQDAVVPALT